MGAPATDFIRKGSEEQLKGASVLLGQSDINNHYRFMCDGN